MTTMSDLVPEMVGEILTRVPIPSLRAVRSTCKSWYTLSEDLIFGKEVVRRQFLGFMAMDYKLFSVRFDLQGVRNGLVDKSINEIERFKHKEISKVFHCEGLVLCVTRNHEEILVWNPYLGHTRLIKPIRSLQITNRYALGHDSNGNHKILKFSKCREAVFKYEIYDFSSDSWKLRSIPSNWSIPPCQCGVSLKGNAYFIASNKGGVAYFLLCFDFTRERFGQLLPFSCHTVGCPVTLSCAREDQLAVLYLEKNDGILDIWVTNKIESNTVSWSKFLKVSMSIKPFKISGLSFFIDEEKRVAVVFGQGEKDSTGTYKTATIIGDDQCLKSVRIGEPDMRNLEFSSYLPSLVQIYQPRKNKRKRYL